ncbi:unnamed protein product [Urochloa decumbens]|uniref:MATH domain-containing protein n=1 Tax=Urochloa decumbens TaxID=240449 RepID=A0ABC9ET98_9POAL
MGNSCITGAGRLNAASFPSEQTTFHWTIDGFSSLLDKGAGWTHSRVFKIMGMEWCLKLNPMVKKSGKEEEYVSLKLELARSSVKPNTIIEASFMFLIYDQSYGKHRKHKVITHSFHTASTRSGTSRMIALNTLRKQSSRFLVKNSCIFGIEFIKVATVKANTTSETLSVQKMNIFNEAKVHTWEIEDFYALKNPDYSPEFEVSGYTWFIRMRPSCDGNHLSIFLKMKRSNLLSRDSANLVELTLSIKDQESDKHKKFSRPGRFQFSNNSRTWGWKKFITLEDFKDSSNGYLVKGKCCIEAEVAVVGSSKTK